MTDLYLQLLEEPNSKVSSQIFNAGYDNHTVMEIAEKVRNGVDERVEIVTVPTDDLRSYHISSEKIKRELGFVAEHTIEEAVSDLVSQAREMAWFWQLDYNDERPHESLGNLSPRIYRQKLENSNLAASH